MDEHSAGTGQISIYVCAGRLYRSESTDQLLYNDSSNIPCSISATSYSQQRWSVYSDGWGSLSAVTTQRLSGEDSLIHARIRSVFLFNHWLIYGQLNRGRPPLSEFTDQHCSSWLNKNFTTFPLDKNLPLNQRLLMGQGMDGSKILWSLLKWLNFNPSMVVHGVYKAQFTADTPG